jgi:26S proteasome regulatory subunit N7
MAGDSTTSTKKDAKKAEEEEQTPSMEEDRTQDPLLVLANQKFLLSSSETPDEEKAALKESVMNIIKLKNMAPFYSHVCELLGWIEDETLSSQMKAVNEKTLKEFDAKELDAKENLGETEVRDAKLARAEYLASIGEKKLALEAYDDADEKTVGMGGKIDLSFAKIRLGLFWRDRAIIKSSIEKAKTQVEKGGDWERRNLLCVYEATELLINRDFKGASTLLLDSVATFGCYKLFDYNTFVLYTVLVSVVTLERVDLRAKVIKSPEILEVINDIPGLRPFLFSLFLCNYGEFFRALSAICKAMKRDSILASHVGYFLREARIVAYKQFLTSYRSVNLDSMAEKFGVSSAFLDKELARFIAVGRLSCAIDKVAGVVETIQPDSKNKQYLEAVKTGDLLLNRVQKLTKFINY